MLCLQWCVLSTILSGKQQLLNKDDTSTPAVYTTIQTGWTNTIHNVCFVKYQIIVNIAAQTQLTLLYDCILNNKNDKSKNENAVR